MKQTEKPRYTVRQNVRCMLRLAWKREKSVIWLCLGFAALSLSINLAQLYIAPEVLQRVEQKAPLGELLGVIAAFSLALVLLSGLLEYVNLNSDFGRIRLRTSIVNDLNDKACTTSYPNTCDPDVLKLKEKAHDSCNGNEKATEHVWTTLSNLLLNVAGLAAYLTVLANLNLLLLLVILLTTAAGFFVSRRINDWGYRHREEEGEYLQKLYYIQGQAESPALAKDIRIFGLMPWLRSVYDSVFRLYEAFTARRERVYAWSCVVDVLLGIARNGIAYWYLISLTLQNGLSASEFLLYFTAFTGFSAWVTGILQEAAVLHKESIGISVVQEYLNLPEPFRFAEGKPVPKADRYELRLEHVSFRYPGAETPIFRDLNLALRPGEKLAVVGLNGAGKTTLVKLLCGFYDPDEGRVLLNGEDIREFDRADYYRLFSAVFQENSELDVTVAETVAQAVSGIDTGRVKDCLERAGLAEQARAFPKGLDTHLGKNVYLDGVELSGGQKQRLMLAGALTLFNSPAVALLLAAILVLAAALSPMCQNRVIQYQLKSAEDAKFGNRLFSAFGFIGDEKERAMDIRMYRQQELARHYLEADVLLASASRYARGSAGASAPF